MAATLLVTDRLIASAGTRRVARWASVLFVLVCAAALVWSVAVGGLGVWPWFGWLLLANGLGAVMSPVCAALALDPVGEIAGVTSSVLNFAALAVGGALAALVDARIDGTVTPMVAGSFVFGSAGALILWWSQPTSSGISDFRRPMKSSISSSTAESIGGGS